MYEKTLDPSHLNVVNPGGVGCLSLVPNNQASVGPTYKRGGFTALRTVFLRGLTVAFHLDVKTWQFKGLLGPQGRPICGAL